MRYLIKGTLYILLATLLLLTVTFAIDTEVARRDYNEAVDNGDYEKQITGCIFDRVCDYYTNLLWSK